MSHNILYTFAIRYRDKDRIRTALVNVGDHKQAEKRADKYPRVISVSKVEYVRVKRDITKCVELDKKLENPYESPIAMDEMIWRKRVKRIENASKDKIDS